MSYERLWSLVNGVPLAMLPREISAIVDVLSRRRSGAAAGVVITPRGERPRLQSGTVRTLYDEARGSERGYALAGGVAVVPVVGPLWKHASMIDAESAPGGTSYEAVIKGLDMAASSGDVAAIALLVDSPGGEALGMTSAVQRMAEILTRSGKPSIAIVDGIAASAAFAIAAIADRIVVGPDTEVGSIGCYAVWVDSSKAYELAGLKANLVASGDDTSIKGHGAEGVPVSPEALKNLQVTVDELAAQFVSHVAEHRGLSAAKVEELADGRVHLGAAAIALGLADEIGDVESALVSLAARSPTQIATGRTRSAAGGAGALPVQAAIRPSKQSRTTARTLSGKRVAMPQPVNPYADSTTTTTTTTTSTPATDETSGGAATLDKENPEQQGGHAGGQAGGNGGDDDGEGEYNDTKAKLPAAQIQAATRRGAAAENARQRAIDAVAKSFAHVKGTEVLVDAARKNPDTSAESLAMECVKMSAKANPPVGSIDVTVGRAGNERKATDMQIALGFQLIPAVRDMLEAGGPKADRAARTLGATSAADALAAVDRLASAGITRLGPQRLAYECAVMGGRVRAGTFPDPSEIATDVFRGRSAHVTGDFPGLFRNGVNRTLQAAMTMYSPLWSTIAARGSAVDFRDQEVIRVGDGGQLKELREGEDTPEVTIGERVEKGRLKTRGAKIVITRQMLINDNLGGITQAVQGMLRRATNLPDQELMGALFQSQSTGMGRVMSDNLPFFHPNRGNTGAAADITNATITAAVQSMGRQRTINAREEDRDFVPFNPAFVIVSQSRELDAIREVETPVLPLLSNANTAIINPLQRKGIRALASVYIPRANGWLVSSAPGDLPIAQVNFLNGREVPSFEEVETGTAQRLAFEALYDFNVLLLNPEGCYGNPGL